eukprot:TRINITY_DN3537_c0_g1_i1.p1 TRINITY_DN3537_c0_g1~~TRINITY_DN3537_c0_g1_i1.p1  ORF type:complete len:343 (+),score=56.91 TRINITY_DN3537_c0_g1_i1:47-1030(+)
MPRTLLKRSAALTALCTAESLPAECPVHAVDDKVWRGVPQAPALYPVGDSEVYSVAVSPCGRLCCAGTTTGDVFVYSTITGEQMMHNKVGPKQVPSVAFSRDGTYLAVSAGSGAVVFCTETWTALKQLAYQGIQRVRWTHRGRLVTLAGQQMQLWGVLTGACLKNHVSGVTSHFDALAVSRMSIFAADSKRHCICVFDVDSFVQTHTYEGHTSYVYTLALTDDEQQLVSGSSDKTVKVWCTTSHTLLRTITLSRHSAYHVAVSQKSDVLAMGEDIGFSFVYLLKFSTGECVGRIEQSTYSHIALSPCGTRVFTRGKHGVQVSATNTA